MANPFVHIELRTSDVKKAKKFYGGLFGWQLEDTADMQYTMVNVGEGTGGGIMKNPVSVSPDAWLPYIMVDDAAASTKKALSLGAKVQQEVTEIPGMGWFSLIKDPTGADLGLWQPKTGKTQEPRAEKVGAAQGGAA